MVNDAFLYFHESYLISEVIKKGEWIGPYGVGVHGFLFKIPAALLFLLTGPSVWAVTIYHIILAAVVVFLMYRLATKVLKNRNQGLLAMIILVSNFHFFLSPVTYLREIPTILVVLLLLDHLISRFKRHNLVLGLLFLLLLDVKEYVFIIFSLFYVVWMFIDSKEEKFLKKVWGVIKQSVVVFLPSLIWIILMFTTHIVPVNMFLASIIGLKDNAFGYLASHFDIETSTANSLEGGKNMFFIVISETWPPVIVFLCEIVNTILSYLGKVLYPRVFSFLSVPKVVILPVVISAVINIKRFVLAKKKELRAIALLSTLILTWLLIYILRASHGRYLLPVVPAIAIVYVFLLFKQKLTLKQKKAIFIATFLYVSAGVYFETSYVLPKVLLEYSVLTLFMTMFIKPGIRYVRYLLILILAAGSVGSAVLFSYVQGQIYGYLNWGRNRNAEQIAEIIPDDTVYWINSPRNASLISVYNKEAYLRPEWKWGLSELVPIRDSFKAIGELQSYTFRIGDIKTFKENLEKYEIESLIFIKTDLDGEDYPDQEYFDELVSVSSWLRFEKKVEYKGMEVYIFDIVR
jgi:4-amino-4-deoxy-L-arabinose transferase-like glycosyltransferase